MVFFRQVLSGSFVKNDNVKFRAKWGVSQNASTESLFFLSLIYVVLKKNGANHLNFEYRKSLPHLKRYAATATSSRKKSVESFWFIDLTCKNQADILNVILPYFNQLHGLKFERVAKLQRIFNLNDILDSYLNSESKKHTFSLSVPLSISDEAETISQSMGAQTVIYKLKAEIIYTVYSLTRSSLTKRKISLLKKLEWILVIFLMY